MWVALGSPRSGERGEYGGAGEREGAALGVARVPPFACECVWSPGLIILGT